MIKFTKRQAAQYAALVARISAAAEAVETAYADFKQRQQDAWEASGADAATTAYNDAVQEFEDFRDEIATAMQDYIADRSDTWLESDRGGDYEAWANAWDTVLDELEAEPPLVPDAPVHPMHAKYPLTIEEA